MVAQALGVVVLVIQYCVCFTNIKFVVYVVF